MSASTSSSEDHHDDSDAYVSCTDESDSLNLPDNDPNSSSQEGAASSNNLPTDINQLQQETDIFFLLLSLVCKISHLDMR